MQYNLKWEYRRQTVGSSTDCTGGMLIARNVELASHRRQEEDKKKPCKSSDLHGFAGTGDRIRTNDTPGMKVSELRFKQGFYIIWKGKVFDLCGVCGVGF